MSKAFLGFRRRKNSSKQQSAGKNFNSRLGVESLERRAMLAADALAGFSGTVSLDTDNDGVLDSGEEIQGATIQVWQDTDGNGTFNDSDDTLIESAMTDANGQYIVDGLMSGDYFVVQPEQTVGTTSLDLRVSARKTVDGSGAAGPLIDNFSDDSTPAVDTHPPDGSAESVFQASGNAIGGERDFEAEITSGMSGDEVEVRTDAGMLLFNPDFFAQGIYSLTWDGTDGSSALDATGLGGVDFLSGVDDGGICLTDVSFDQSGGQITVTVYSDAMNFSEAVIDNITPFTNNDFFISFDPTSSGLRFEATGGTGADFSNVGAIELEVLSTSQAMDGAMDLIGVFNADITDCDFINPAPIPNIDIEKATNGFDADTTGGTDVPVVNSGGSVTWTYVVENTGQTPINNVVVTDDNGTPADATDDFNPTFSGGDSNGDNVLDLDETWTYTANGVAISGTYTNKATVNGLSTTSVEVMDMDNSNYVGISPDIDIEKLTNGNQADNATDADVPTIIAGDPVTWTYIVTNTGTDPLTNVTVNDDQIGPITNVTTRSINNDDILDPGEVWTYTASGTATVGNYVNQADVAGTASDGTTIVDDLDRSRYVGIQTNPAIDIEKATNSQDADVAGTGPVVSVGDTVTFAYVVTNSGDVPLQNVVVVDDNGTPNDTTDDFSPSFVGGDTDSDNQLDLSESWNYTADRVATLGLYTNIAEVTAEDARNQGVSDSDPSSHSAIEPTMLSLRLCIF